MAATSKRFCDSFWDTNDEGFAILMERMKTAKHTCAELEDVFKARAEMEEDIGKKLLKLAKGSSLGKEETGTLKDALDTFRTELEENGKAKLSLSDEIRSKLEKPTNNFMNEQRDVRKEHQNAVEKSQKARVSQQAAMIKAEERFKLRCIELEQLNEQKAKGPKDAEKMEAKLIKAAAAVRSADQEYLAASDKLRELHTLWVKDMFSACEAFQKLEEERLDFLRNILWAYANITSNGCVNDDECYERIRKCLERCDVTRDIQAFIKSKATGTTIPAPADYQGLNRKEKRDPIDYALPAPIVPVPPPEMKELKPSAPTISPVSAAILDEGTSHSTPERQQEEPTSSTFISEPPPYTSPRTHSAEAQLASMEKSSLKEDNYIQKKSSSPIADIASDAQTSGSDKAEQQSTESIIEKGNPFATDMQGTSQQESTTKTSNVAKQPPQSATPTDEWNPFGSQELNAIPTLPSPNSKIAQPPKKKPLFRVRILYNYDAQSTQELTLDVGQTVFVFDLPKVGWYYGQLQIGKAETWGLFPIEITEKIQ